MMYKAFLVKYAEIGIKGKNRHLFEKALCVQMEHALAPVDGNFQVTREMGRIYVNTEGDFDYEGAVDALTRVFGIAEICPVVILEDTGFEDLAEAVVSYVKELYPTEEPTSPRTSRRARATSTSASSWREKPVSAPCRAARSSMNRSTILCVCTSRRRMRRCTLRWIG